MSRKSPDPQPEALGSSVGEFQEMKCTKALTAPQGGCPLSLSAPNDPTRVRVGHQPGGLGHVLT